ncbi:hypothetical protein DFH09DRAFT_1310403 [Mycena vulgaris]|nr:hypothetical protein DFH09DRAFT_1310403 [Mycena vulgaris]
MASKSHKRKTAIPQVVVGARGVASTSSESRDKRRVRTRREVTESQVAWPSNTGSSFEYEEDWATRAGRAAVDFTWALGDTSLEAQPDEVVDDGIQVIVGKPRNKNSDRPLQTWMSHCDEYVEAQIAAEGRGPRVVWERCAGVRCVDRKVECANAGCSAGGEYCCVEPGCAVVGTWCANVWTLVMRMRSASAMLLRNVPTQSVRIGSARGKRSTVVLMQLHAQLPTHFVEKWNGRYFVRRRTGLRDLGLRTQLGHPPGVVCPFKKPAPRDFVLYDTTGVHEISVDFCGCQPRVEHRLQLMQMSWWPATVKASKYMRHICRPEAIPDPELSGEAFGPPVRSPEAIHAHNATVARGEAAQAGQTRHKKGGVRATAQGELALPCRACPQPGWNIPEGWEDIPFLYRYLYFLFLAQDANFRLTNRNVSSEEADPIFGDGFGFFAKREGEDGYKAHIGKNANEQEISSCSGFQAMFLANSKRVKGLRTTGIAGVTCSRHNMWRPNGIDDLQVGERYCNLDFLMLSALLVFAMLYVVLSYDIASQDPEGEPVVEGPKFPSAPAQNTVPFTLLVSLHVRAGMTHGEGVEQNWSFSNGAAASTKLMGPGSRHATLEDIFGFHNYDRQLAMHRVLAKRLAVNLKEAAKHKAALDAFTTGLEVERAEEVEGWRSWVMRWEAKQHTTPEDSPFEYKEAVTTLREIQLKIATEEFICTEDGVEVEQESTPSTFIMMGLGLEDLQRRLEIDVKALQHPTASQKLGFMKRRMTLLKKIHRFREVQRVYMPSLRGFLSDWERQVLDGNGEQAPETTRLFMPSEVSEPTNRRRACAVGLGEIEARMREGEASEALEVVRQGLRARTMTNRFRIKNYTGQGALTRGQGILRQINLKIHLAKLHYRYSRGALVALHGNGVWEERLKVLRDDDVWALNERSLAAEGEAQGEQLDDLARAVGSAAGVSVVEGLAAGECRHTLSWIWYTVGTTTDDDDPKLHEALRVEWCKAYARARRLDEDIRLLREEMRRTIAFGYTEAGKWDVLAGEELPGVSAELTEGRQAYAAEKADRERDTCALLTKKWGGEFWGRRTTEVTVVLELGDELDPEDEEALLEGDYEED